MKKNNRILIVIIIVILLGTFAFFKIHNKEAEVLQKNNSQEVNKQEESIEVPQEESDVLSKEKNELIDENETSDSNSNQKKEKSKKETNNANTENKEEKKDNESKKNTTNIEGNKEQLESVNNETKEITKISFEKASITKEVYGRPPNETNSGEIIITDSKPSISLSELKKANKLTIYPESFKNASIKWSSSSKSVANFEGDILYVYKFGETTITATTENGKSASYKLKLVGVIDAFGVIKSGRDCSKPKCTNVVYMNVNHNSASRCDKKRKFEVELKLYKDGNLVQTEKVQPETNYSIIKTEYAAGTYRGEYKITDLCTNHTISGKAKETTFSDNG